MNVVELIAHRREIPLDRAVAAHRPIETDPLLVRAVVARRRPILARLLGVPQGGRVEAAFSITEHGAHVQKIGTVTQK